MYFNTELHSYSSFVSLQTKTSKMSSFLSVFSRISIVVPSPANVFAITQKSKESKRKVQNATAQKVKKIVKLKWSQNNHINLTNFFAEEALHHHIESNPFPCRPFQLTKWHFWNPEEIYGAAKSGWVYTTKIDPDH